MKYLFLIAFVLFPVFTPVSAEVYGVSAMAPRLITEVRKACVEVLVDRQLRGGGAIVESGGGKAYVITAAHLFPRPNAYITIMTEEHGIHNANLVAYDFGHDLALLEIATKLTLPVLKVASYTPSPTQPVYNFGPALRRRTLVISGHMAESRVNYTDFEPSDGYLAHIFIAAINPVLTSGGVWVNQKGEIIGVQSGRLKGDAGAPSSGLSMACPPSAIRRLLKTKSIANTPGIGGWVWELWTVEKKILANVPEDIQGLAVRWVREGGALSRAGVSANEIIIACDGKRIIRRNDLFPLIRSKPVGTAFSLTIYSPNSRRTRKVQMNTLPLESRW
ncbi:MAG: S1C family serine protease, partial [Verrucomicrobiales bacterium]|nr:S1C family serine protease [Verrucomicrobiales bacterium]